MANEKILVDLILRDKDFKKGVQGAVKDTQKLEKTGNSSTNTLAAGFKAVGAAILAIGLKDLIVDLAKTAATAQSVESAFANSFDPSVLRSMREAVNGTVSDISLMQKALNAKNLKIPIETLNAGLKLAKQRASETGESVEFLAQSVVLGLGRESALILDNLGISAKRLSEEAEKSGDFMSAAAKIINTELANAPDTVDDLADSLAQMAAEAENVKTEIAKELTPVYAVFNSILLESIKQMKRWANISTEMTEQELAHADGVRNLTEDYKYNLISLEKLKDAAAVLEKRIESNKRIHGETDIRVKNLTESYSQYTEAIRKIELQELTDKENKAAKAAEKHAKAQEKLNAELTKRGNQLSTEATTISEGSIFPDDPTAQTTYGAGTNMANALAQFEALNDASEKVRENIDENVIQPLTAGDLIAIQFADSMVDGMFDAIAAGENFGEVMSGVIKSMIADIIKLIVKMAILNALFPGAGGALGAGGGIFGGILGRNAGGTNNFGGGFTMVGESGPEMVALPGGSKIFPHSRTMAMGGGQELFSVVRGSDLIMASSRTSTNRMR